MEPIPVLFVDDDEKRVRTFKRAVSDINDRFGGLKLELLVAADVDEAIMVIDTLQLLGRRPIVSLDHDMLPEHYGRIGLWPSGSGTGMDVAESICAKAPAFMPTHVNVHTMNGLAAMEMENMLRCALTSCSVTRSVFGGFDWLRVAAEDRLGVVRG